MMTHAAWLLLIPAAAAIGWLAGRRGGEIKGGARVSRLSNTYFRGLNYLLHEQQDKAIEIFLQIAEVDKDTVETQFALGYLFRRRGEVDRAIRLHQSLVSRHGLSEEQKTRAVLALGASAATGFALSLLNCQQPNTPTTATAAARTRTAGRWALVMRTP